MGGAGGGRHACIPISTQIMTLTGSAVRQYGLLISETVTDVNHKDKTRQGSAIVGSQHNHVYFRAVGPLHAAVGPARRQLGSRKRGFALIRGFALLGP